MKERYSDKDLQRYNPERDHDKKLTVIEYKENEDMKRELEQERLCFWNERERLNEIEKQCYWAERGVGDYPEPEQNNPERDISYSRER